MLYAKRMKRLRWESSLQSHQGFFYNHNGVIGTLRFGVTSNGYKDGIPQRGFVWNVYMAQPKGFVMEEKERMWCCL